MSEYVVVIPARMASSRLPNKPLADIAGKPMVVRVAEQALKTTAKQVVVATDHIAIVEVCEAYGIEAVLTREDHTSGTDRLAEVVNLLSLSQDQILVNVQGDEPLIDPQLIENLAEELAKTHCPMATAAHPIVHAAEMFNPNVVKVILNHQQQALYFSRAPIPYARDLFAKRQDVLPSDMTVLRHIGIYAYRAGFLQQYTQLPVSPLEQVEALEQLRVLYHGYPIQVLTIHEAPPAGVDTQEDLDRVRHWFDRV